MIQKSTDRNVRDPSIKKDCYACKWLENVDMRMYAKFDQNIPCGSRVMSI